MLSKQSSDEQILSSSILVVDDNPDSIEITQEMLSRNGFTSVTVEQNAVRALSRVITDEFKVILLDLLMPKMHGFVFLEELRKYNLGISVFIVTGMNDQETCMRAFDLGATEFITKPFKEKELVARLRRLLVTSINQKLLATKAQFFEEIASDRTIELEQAQSEIIRRLSRASEFRDNETGLHVVRMSHYSQAVATALQLPKRTVNLILHAAPMHDVGKIGIPDAILLKPGPLTDAEWLIMKTHPTIGGKILGGSSVGLIQAAAEIALTHHERWDGSGYPAGLCGQEIPISGQIIAIADVFDALTSTRPYKKAWAFDDAFVFIQKQVGKHFSPAVVAAFEKALPEITETYQQFQE